MGKAKNKSKYIEKTLRDCTVCPYCGSCDTDVIDAWSNEDGTESESRRCYFCETDYEVTFDGDENTIDVCDRHNFSLLN